MATETPDAIEAAVIKVAQGVAEQARVASNWGSTEWTNQLNRQLGELGVSFGYHPCGHSCVGLKNGYGEFLWDMVWARYRDGGNLLEFTLALEHEWGGGEKIDEDFEKLLFARAEHRAMIFQGSDGEAHFARLCKILDNSDYVKPGERFLLLCWWSDGFTSCVFVKGTQP
ncbi:MAG TPA: hypothetical protein VGG11_17205 [Xanthobacteraceae bacterium]